MGRNNNDDTCTVTIEDATHNPSWGEITSLPMPQPANILHSQSLMGRNNLVSILQGFTLISLTIPHGEK